MKTHTITTRVLALASGLALAAHTGVAADAYVAKWGNDGNSGLNWANAKLTVNAALGVATTPGDTIYVGTGTYSGTGNIDLNWSARNGVNLVGDGPTRTVFVLSGAQRLASGLENKTQPTTFASFKVDARAKDEGFDGAASVLFVGDAIPLNLVFSNLWMTGRYDGDQVKGIPGTTGKRNGCAIEFNWYGNAAAYTGMVTVTHCLFERFGRVLYTDDDNATAIGCYTVRFDRCTFVNNNDTSSGYWETFPFTLRGTDHGKWIQFNRCVMSHSAQDTTQTDRHGVRWYPVAPPTRVDLNDNLFYTNTIGRGANNMYGPSVAGYSGYASDIVNVAPNYAVFGGRAYTLIIPEGGTERGWHCTTNQNVPVIAITPAATWVPRSTANYTQLAGTSTNLAGSIVWQNAANGQQGSVTAAASWNVAAVPLALGPNVITVTGTNSIGEQAQDTVSVYRDFETAQLAVMPAEVWLENHETTYTIVGVPSNVAGAITWQNAATGAGGAVPGATPFVVPSIAVSVGTNDIVLTAANAYNEVAVQTVTVYRTGVPANYYVSTTGNDTTGDGSAGNPWRTINKAVSTAPNGTFMQPTLVNVAAGTYDTEAQGGNWGIYPNGKQYFIIAGAGSAQTELRKGALSLALPTIRIDNCSFFALRDMNLDMSGELLAWSDHNSAIRVQSYNLVTLQDLWLKGPVNTAYRNGHAIQVAGAATTRNVVARRVLMDGFGRGAYVTGNSATGPATILFEQCTFVNQEGQSSYDDSIAIWSRANGGTSGRDIVMVRGCVIANQRRGVGSDSSNNKNSIGLALVNSYGNVFTNVGVYKYFCGTGGNGETFMASVILNDRVTNPGFVTLADTRPYVAQAVYGKGWVMTATNTVAPEVTWEGGVIPPGGSAVIVTGNVSVTLTGTKLPMSYLLVNGEVAPGVAWGDTAWSYNVTAPAVPGVQETNRFAFVGSPVSQDTLVIMQLIPEPGLMAAAALGMALLLRRR